MGETIRYAIIGAGMMGNEHIRNIAIIDGAEVVAAADPHEGSRDWAKLTMEGKPIELYADYRDLFAKPDSFDALIIATPNHTHKDVVEDALATGKHLLIEKPLCTTFDDCQWIELAASTHPGVVWMGLEYRWMPPVTRFVDEIRAGAVGDVKMLTIREHRFPFLQKVGDWNRFNRNSGGTLVEKSCHFFDLMRHIIGSEPRRVMASGGQDVNHLDETYDGKTPDIMDNAFVIVEFDNGVRACHELCMFVTALEQREHLTVTGTKGALEVTIPQSELAHTLNTGNDTVRTHIEVDQKVLDAGHHHGASYYQHLAFQDAIRSGTKPLVSVGDGLRSVAMGLAAHRSIEQGRIVDMSEFGL
ncbi:Gfo/Idh/MocA family oxidoreductase [Pyruvatibacter sp. HU-CL02332]|uniref:Gfo/Idh/MocA family protein n=1 Tax=Pyruvatibacter sp. HU-CL02332 TaxID=3127650 RepID=UPI00310335BC